MKVDMPEVVSTATPIMPARPESVTLVVDRETAKFLTQVQTLRNKARRGEAEPFAFVRLDDLWIGLVMSLK